MVDRSVTRLVCCSRTTNCSSDILEANGTIYFVGIPQVPTREGRPLNVNRTKLEMRQDNSQATK